MAKFHDIQIKAKNLISRNIKKIEKAKILQIYRLRHQVFVKQLKWVEGDKNLDRDSYDKYAIHFGVFKKSQILGTARIIPHPKHFMMHDDFKHLVGRGHIMRLEDDTVEISRLTLNPKIKGTTFGNHVARLLYKTMYHWSVENNKRYWYFVTSEKLMLSLKKRFNFPVRLTGDIATDTRGLRYAGVFIDLRELEKNLASWNVFKYLTYRWLIKK